jgi:hypothetical protein
MSEIRRKHRTWLLAACCTLFAVSAIVSLKSFSRRYFLTVSHAMPNTAAGHYTTVDGLKLWEHQKDLYVDGVLLERGRLVFFRQPGYSDERHSKIEALSDTVDTSRNYGGICGFSWDSSSAAIPAIAPAVIFTVLTLILVRNHRKNQRSAFECV